MNFDYGKMQATATKLFSKFNQGVIQYEQQGTVTGPAWNPTMGTPTLHKIEATALGVAKEYIDGTTILATDLSVKCGVFDVEPDMSGKVIIDGKPHDIIKIMPKPAAGTTVAWELIVRA